MKRISGLILLLVFPMVGFGAMLWILINSDDYKAAQTINYPTPLPLRATSVPTMIPPTSVLELPAADSPLTTLEGESFTLADYQGKIVVLNFWATWCEPCVREMPLLNQYAADHPEIVVLSVTDPEDGQSIEGIQEFITKYELTHISFGLDQRGNLKYAFGAQQIPMTFVLNEEGIVIARQIGEVTAADLDYYLQ